MKIQDYKPFVRPTVLSPQRETLTLPAFSVDPAEWTGASTILRRFPFQNTYYFSIRTPVVEFGSNFVLAVSWVADGITYRYKFWDAGVLYYPVYDGERIGLNAVFEIWSVETTGGAVLLADEVFQLSILLFADYCVRSCGNPAGNLTLVMEDPDLLTDYENPFEPDGGIGDEPGGGIQTVDQLAGTYDGYWVFPASGYGKESDNAVYPSNITAAETQFWIQLLNQEWIDSGVSYSERHLAWYFPNHIVTLYDFDAKYNGGGGSPIPAPGDTMTEFAAPWQLTYLWIN